MRKQLAAIIVSIITLTTASGLVSAGEISETQRNSINMLGYLTVLTESINESSASKLYLEEAYSYIINNTNPEAIDEYTEDYLEELRQVLKNFRLIAVKRDRLEYIYEQNKAKAIKAAIPNPIALLSASSALDVKRLVASVIYMAVDAKSSYDAAIADAESEYLESGWELDDAQEETLENSRGSAFQYIIDITQEYKLKKENSLNEQSIQDFVKWRNNDNPTRKLQFYVDNQDTYKDLGIYWLVLADAYYNEQEYEACLNAIDQYKMLDVNVFRLDLEYAKAIPIAIASAKEIYDENDYVAYADNALKELIANTDNKNSDAWDMRYYAAQIYMDLYGITADTEYLSSAYNCVSTNVNLLIDEQLSMNQNYLNDLKEEPVPNGATKEVKKEIKEYNKVQKEMRKKELPPVSEPLVLNCDLLFALAEKLDISEKEKEQWDKKLHNNSTSLFLSSTLDNLYKFDATPIELTGITFDEGKLVIPAKYVPEGADVSITVTGEDEPINDWVVKEVKRKKTKKEEVRTIDSIEVIFSSKKAKKTKYHEGDVITVSITPKADAEPNTTSFTTEEGKLLWIIPQQVYKDAGDN